MVRRLVREGSERLLVSTGVAGILGRRWSHRRLILAYHNVVPPSAPPWGERPLHIRLDHFRAHVDTLRTRAVVVPLERIVDPAPLEGKGPFVALTFDDGYAGAVHAIESELVPRGIPSTIFVNPGHPRGQAFWWDLLAETVAEGGLLPAQLRERCLEELRGEQERVRAWTLEEGWPEPDAPDPSYLPIPASTLNERFSGNALVSLASHGWSHANLAALPPASLGSELCQARDWFEEEGIGISGGVAYPYGRSSERVERTAREAGYPCAYLVEGGFLPEGFAPSEVHRLPRLSIPSGLTANGLALRLAGIRAH